MIENKFPEVLDVGSSREVYVFIYDITRDNGEARISQVRQNNCKGIRRGYPPVEHLFPNKKTTRPRKNYQRCKR